MSYLLPITLKRFNSVDWKNFQAFVAEQIDGAEAAVSKLNTQREVLRATTERTENVLSQYFQYVKSTPGNISHQILHTGGGITPVETQFSAIFGC